MPVFVIVSPAPAPEVLATAALLGVIEFYAIGGAQAIAALAYGTQSIPRVDPREKPDICVVAPVSGLMENTATLPAPWFATKAKWP